MERSAPARNGASVTPHRPRIHVAIGVGAEWMLLALWTVALLHAYLNLDSATAPAGREYFTSIQSNFLWDRAMQCGMCAFWNGSIAGGYPALIDPHDAALHPVVAVASLIWGALNGAKIALVVMFFVAGIAQWWLAYVLGLGRVARVWSGALAIAGGHLAGKLDQGVYAVVVSTVACALMLPPLIALTQRGSIRAAAIFGVTLGMALVAGQGYLQIGFVLVSPILIVLLLNNPIGAWLLIRRLTLALAIGILLAGPFLVPLARFSPSFAKDIDPRFDSAEPFGDALLDFVNRDAGYYRAGGEGRQPFPFLYVNYVGWIPVALAGIGIVTSWRLRPRQAIFLGGWILLALWVSTAGPLRLLHAVVAPFPALAGFVAGVRNPSLIAGLAVPALLALSAVGVDTLIVRRRQVVVDRSPGARLGRIVADVRWLVVPLLLIALTDARGFAEEWLPVRRLDTTRMEPVLEQLTTPDLTWVQPPFGERFWTGLAIGRGLKLTDAVVVWHWRDRPNPAPAIAATRGDIPPGASPLGRFDGIAVYADTARGRRYAEVSHADGTSTPCQAHGTGGDIDVACALDQPGTLVIEENTYGGWKVTVNGVAAPLAGNGRWLAVSLPAGRATAAFRYRPWDVWVGIVMMVVGLTLAGYGLASNRLPGVRGPIEPVARVASLPTPHHPSA